MIRLYTVSFSGNCHKVLMLLSMLAGLKGSEPFYPHVVSQQGAGPGGTGSQGLCDRANRTRHGTDGYLGHQQVPAAQARPPLGRLARGLDPDGWLERGSAA